MVFWETNRIRIFRETFFFWALPFRSGYAGVSVLDDLPRCRLPLVICNVTVHLTQLRSLTIPNATKRRQSLSSGHLSADRDCPAERYNCTRHHGCTLFHCEVLTAVMAGGLSLLIGYSAARQTELSSMFAPFTRAAHLLLVLSTGHYSVRLIRFMV